MKCVKFRLIQIRNKEDTTILPDEGLTIFTGENGSGKTNLIEAVYYASIGKSFRTGNDNEMIRLGDEEGTILLDFTIRDVSHTIKVKLTRNQGKRIFFNDNPVRKKDLMGLFRTVIFTPDELQLIKGAPVFRRRFLDMEISQVSPRYYAELLRYTRAVQQRNAAFRNARMTGIIPDTDIWDEQIGKCAAYIVRKRLETVKKMNGTVPDMESALTGNRENLEIRYKQAGSDEPRFDEEWFLERLAAYREEDAKFCHTSVGPHRDDLTFFMNGMDISIYGSQGQQRTAILAMKLSEMEYIKEETSEYPVLLLDDIGSELDSKRRKALMNFLETRNIQTMVTGTDVPFDHKAKIIEVGKE